MKSPKKKGLTGKVLVVILCVASLVALYFAYQYAYKKGYAEGTNNQVICQASVSNPTLTRLCK
jgi:hypothetical protein